MTHNLSSLCHQAERGLFGARYLPTRRLCVVGHWALALALLVTCVWIGGPAQAQKNSSGPSLQVDKSVSGNLVYWFASGANSLTAPTVLHYQPRIPTPLTGPSDGTLKVVNVTQGTVAHLTVNKQHPTPLKAEDFTYAETVQVPVKYKGDPVQDILVLMQYDEGGTTVQKSYWLQPSDGGVAHFSDVPLNKILTIKVSDGNAISPAAITGSVFHEKPGDPYRFQEVTVPEDWNGVQKAAVAAEGGKSSTGGGSVPPGPNNNNVINIITSVVVGVLVLAVLLFWLIDTGRLKTLMPSAATTAGPAPSPFQPAPARPSPVPMEAAGDISSSGPVSGPRLIATLGAYAGSIFPLTDNNTHIGRDIANTVALAQDTAASRRHAHIQANNGQYVLVDDGSSNGTYVNGIRIASQNPKPLRPGDEVQIGTTRFRFEV
jgi:hypothetical protein